MSRPHLVRVALAGALCSATLAGTSAAAPPTGPPPNHEPLHSGETVELVLRTGERREGTYTGTVTPPSDNRSGYAFVDHEDWHPSPLNSFALVDQDGLRTVRLRDVERAAVRRGRTHDGLQLRGTLGVGIMELQTRFRSGPFIGNGLARGLELYGGGTPARGLTTGGFFAISGAPITNARDGQHEEFGMALAALGPYVDYYADPHEGFHVLATLGGAMTLIRTTAGFADVTGIAASAGVGYDFWIASELGTGFLVRVGRTWLEGGALQDGTVDLATVALSFAYQ